MSESLSFADRLRAGWTRLPPAVQDRVLSAIHAAVMQRLNEDPWYSSFSPPPQLEVLGASPRSGGLCIHFIADHQNYCYAQSGSDWADHNLFAGDLDLQQPPGGVLSPVRIQQVGHVHVSEQHWDEGYDRKPAVQRVRDAQIAAILQTAGPHLDPR